MMSPLEEFLIPYPFERETTTPEGVRLRVSFEGRRYWADLHVEARGAALNATDFIRFPRDGDVLTPRACIEAARWRGVLFLWGETALIVAAPGLVRLVDLYRERGDDRGFYLARWLELGDRLVLIYEGGVICIREGGEIAWHHGKLWNDTLASHSESSLRFDDGDCALIVDVATGWIRREVARREGGRWG